VLLTQVQTTRFESRRPDYDFKAIPKTIFLCGGANAAGSTMVVTTSQDIWWGMRPISQWAQNNRLTTRPSKAPITTPPAMDVVALSQSIYDKLNGVQRLANSASTADATAGVRAAAITEWKNASPARVANHAAEIATPLACPTFMFKARCLRCQAMFNYNVNSAIKTLEANWRGINTTRNGDRGQLDRLCYKGFNCAETIAHFYCTHARGANRNH
jgi:hypothetical protein